MSIFPATDLVLDVGRAADPSKRDAALNRLERMSGAASAEKFSADSPTSSRALRSSPYGAMSTHAASRMPTTSAHASTEAPAVYKKFEAFILQTWLETLLPKLEGGAYGHDNAGGVWRSMMAEQLGDQLAKSDSLGLARVIGSGKTSEIDPAQNSPADLSKAHES